MPHVHVWPRSAVYREWRVSRCAAARRVVQSRQRWARAHRFAPWFQTLLPPYTTAVNSSSACTAHATLISVCNHSCDWCRRDGAAHRAQSAGSGRRARRLTGSGSEPSAASLLHTAPQLRTAGRDEQTSCKSRRADTRPAACEQRLLQLRCRWASASSVGQLVSAAQPAVGAANTSCRPWISK